MAPHPSRTPGLGQPRSLSSRTASFGPCLAAWAVLLSFPPGVLAADADAPVASADLRLLIAEQSRQLERTKLMIAAQEAELDVLRKRVDREVGPTKTSAPRASPAAVEAATPAAETASFANAGLQIPALFQQPGVLTPQNKFIYEPSFQYSYSSSSSVALVGYTVIPAILVGLIDVRDVKSTTLTGALALRYGLTTRAEIEARVPFVYRYDTSIGRAPLAGSQANSTFDANGRGIGDVEFTGRYQLNDGGPEKAYYVGSLRVKTRTGKDPFQIPVSTSVTGFNGQGLQSELPAGSGFYGIQPALTMILPSDPAVFFGSVSALYSPKRRNVTRQTDQGKESLGTIAPGLILGFNLGMGLALNEKSSFSIGYDHSSIGRTLHNGAVAADSVRLQLGTLLLGLSYRLDDRRSINLSLGAGLTRDTPDVTLTVRIPTNL